jgi:long-chain fatty acid transport protein
VVVKAISNRADLVFDGTKILGCDNGLGFGWGNMDIGKIGLQWDYRPDLTFRAGFSLNNAIIKENDYLFNILAPAVIRKHYTLGLTKKFEDNKEFNFALMYAPDETVHGTNPNTGDQTGSIHMKQMEIEISWGWIF